MALTTEGLTLGPKPPNTRWRQEGEAALSSLRPANHALGLILPLAQPRVEKVGGFLLLRFFTFKWKK